MNNNQILPNRDSKSLIIFRYLFGRYQTMLWVCDIARLNCSGLLCPLWHHNIAWHLFGDKIKISVDFINLGTRWCCNLLTWPTYNFVSFWRSVQNLISHVKSMLTMPWLSSGFAVLLFPIHIQNMQYTNLCIHPYQCTCH